MHRFLERFSAFAGTAVIFVYLGALFLGTASYFASQAIGVDLQFAVATAFALALAFECHSFLSQRLTRFWYQARAKLDQTQPEWDAADAQFHVHLWITVGLVLFSAFNSIAFWALILKPQDFGAWLQCFIRGAVTPAAFLAAGFLAPLQHDAAQMLQGASATMLRKAMKITIKQWQRRLETARKANVNLAPVAVALMEDAHEAAAARRLRIIDAALTAAEGKPSVRTDGVDAPVFALSGPSRPPTGRGSPTGARPVRTPASDATGAQEASETMADRRVVTFAQRRSPSARIKARQTRQARQVRTGEAGNASYEAEARAAWTNGHRTVTKMERNTTMGHTAAQSWVRTLKAEGRSAHDSVSEAAAQ